MIHTLNKQARVVRRVSVSAQRSVGVADVPEQVFRAALSPPGDFSLSTQDSPRENPSATLRWRSGPFGPTPPPQAGARIDVDGRVYEALAGPLELRHGSRVVGYELPVMPVNLLYPLTGTLVQQDGVAIIPAMSLALWETSDDHADRGEYLNFDGEAPPEYAADFMRNRALMVGTERHVITSALVDATGPRVRFSTRVTTRG